MGEAICKYILKYGQFYLVMWHIWSAVFNLICVGAELYKKQYWLSRGKSKFQIKIRKFKNKI